jgi:outer membrane protein insertion porin family/translocation and assembly module TamA
VFALLLFALALAAPLHRAQGQELDRLTAEDSILVGDVRFEGRFGSLDGDVGPGQLLDLVNTRPSPGGLATFLWSVAEWLPFASEPRYFDAAVFHGDVEALREFYRSNGYFSAQVDGEPVVEDSGSVAAVFRIDAGLRSRIDTVVVRNIDQIVDTVWRGSRRIRREIDSSSLLWQPGPEGRRSYGSYNASLVEQEADRILRVLGNNGYPLAAIENISVERKLSDSTLIIRLPLRLGPRLRFGPRTDSLTGGGPMNLKGDIIRGRMEFNTGRLYSREIRDRAETNMNRLGIYSGARLVPHFPPPGDTAQSLVPMTLVLTAKDQHELVPDILVNNKLGRINGGAGLTYLFRNPGREAQTLSLRGDVLGKIDWPVDNYQTTLQLRLDLPYLFHNDLSGSITPSFIFANEQGNYSGSILQLLFGTKWRAMERVQATADWTLEQSAYDEIVTSLVNSVFAGFDTTGVNFRNSILGAGVEADYTNDFFNPTGGRSVKVTLEEAGVFKNLLPGFSAGYQSTEYIKFETLLRSFTDLSANATAVFAAKVKVGGIFRYGESHSDDIPVPVYRRYYAGGSTSVRAWHSRTLSVEGERRASAGGHALLEAGLEYRWQPFPARHDLLVVTSDQIWLVLFADAGNVWPRPSALRLSECAVGTGIGLRLNWFFGPVRVDYAFRAYDPLASDSRWMTQRRFWKDVFLKGVVQFGIGHAF